MSILVRISNAHDAAFDETDAARALDLQKERFDRIVDEDKLLAGQRRRARFDVLSRPVRNHALALDAAAQPLVLELGIELCEVDRQQIVRRRVERITVSITPDAAAVEERLVIAGHEAGVLAILGERAVCGKMPLEECSHRRRVARIDRSCYGAGLAPDGCGCLLTNERRATGGERGPVVGERVLAPARQLGERDGAEYRARRVGYGD